ncbi:MAG TPA: CHAT domain-containing protein [Pyrinomonadaceae bacterium]
MVARTLAEEAGRLRAEWVEASLRRAAEKYKAASLEWRAAHSLRDAAALLSEAAGVYFLLGEYKTALELYRRAATESALAGDAEGEAESVCRAGRLFSYLGDNDEALRQLKRGLAYYAAPGIEQTPRLRRSHAEALTHLGEIYYSKGDLLKSSEHLNRALQIYAEVGDTVGAARAQLFSGYIAAQIGEEEKAAEIFDRTLALYREAGDRSGEALSLTALGISKSQKLKEEEAVKLHREAMGIFRVIGDSQGEAITLNGVGQAYQNLREYDRALENYDQALKLFLSKGSNDFATATLYQIATVYQAKGDDRQSLEYFDRCASLSRAAKAKRMEAYAISEAASIYASQGRRRQTLGQYGKLERFYAAVGDTRGQALTLNKMGDFFLASGDAASALASYRRALALSGLAGEPDVEVSTLYNITRAEREAGNFEDALSTIGRAVELIESLRSNIASPDFRSSYSSGARRHYELRVQLLMEMERMRPGRGYAAEALAVSERARARSLLELLAEAGTDIKQGADPSVLARVRQVEQLLKVHAQYRLGIRTEGRAEAEVEEAEREVDKLRGEYQELQAQIREQNPRRSPLTPPRALNLEEIQAELGDGNTLLLEYMLGSEKSYLWAVTKDSLDGYELPPREVLEKTARGLYESLVARQAAGRADDSYLQHVGAADRAYMEQARELSRMLLGPVSERLGDKRLLVIAEGVLQYIPFDALPKPSSDDPTPLVSRHEVVYLPSISILPGIRLDRPRAETPSEGVSVLADPIFNRGDERLQRGEQGGGEGQGTGSELALRAVKEFDGMRGGLARLAYTSDEAEAIMSALPLGAGTAAKGFDASRATATGPAVGRAQVIHFATHGLINSERPELSGIVLSMYNRKGEREDGFLDLQDIYNLRLSADLVVLSACETGLGKDVKGEGLVGLTRGFMYAGSKSVVASLWKVDDRATSELMRLFYEAMFRDGLTPSAALRTAKEGVRSQERWSAPYFWAGFVLQGEYKEGIKVRHGAWPLAVAVAVLSLILIAVAVLVFVRHRRSGARQPESPGLTPARQSRPAAHRPSPS